jgi:hypothetical protein
MVVNGTVRTQRDRFSVSLTGGVIVAEQRVSETKYCPGPIIVTAG